MVEEQTKVPEYEKPEIADYGALVKLTAGSATGPATDATFPPNTPFSQLTFS